MSFFRSIFDPTFSKATEISPVGGLHVSEDIRLVGSSFAYSSIDANVWTTSLSAGGTVTQGLGEATVATNTTANGSAAIFSNKIARYVSGSPNFYHGVIRTSDVGTANNTRRWGAFTPTDGCFFQLSGTVFSLVLRKNSVDTVITSFNGSSFTYDTNVHTYDIHFTPTDVYFVVDDILVHKHHASTATWSGTLHLPVRIENTNAGGSTTSVSLFVRLSNVSRYSSTIPRPSFVRVFQAGTHLLKASPGSLRRFVICTPGTSSTFTVYDSLTASGTVIAQINTAGAPNSLAFDLDFSIGLTVVASSTPGDCTIVFD